MISYVDSEYKALLVDGIVVSLFNQSALLPSRLKVSLGKEGKLVLRFSK